MDASTGHDESASTQTTEIPTLPSASTYSFTLQEWAELHALRCRYEQSHDLFSASEIERLRFIRWLVTTSRLDA